MAEFLQQLGCFWFARIEGRWKKYSTREKDLGELRLGYLVQFEHQKQTYFVIGVRKSVLCGYSLQTKDWFKTPAASTCQVVSRDVDLFIERLETFYWKFSDDHDEVFYARNLRARFGVSFGEYVEKHRCHIIGENDDGQLCGVNDNNELVVVAEYEDDQPARLTYPLKAFADFTFSVDGVLFEAQKCILAALGGPYFSRLLQGNFKVEQPFVLQDILPSTFQSVLEFIYTQKTTVTEENFLELFSASEYFLLPSLKTFLRRKAALYRQEYLHNMLLVEDPVLNVMGIQEAVKNQALVDIRPLRPDIQQQLWLSTQLGAPVNK